MENAGPEKFGAFIERARRNHRWSQHQFGQMVGVGSSSITSVENGETWPSEHFIDECARLWGVRHEHLSAMLGPKPTSDTTGPRLAL